MISQKDEPSLSLAIIGYGLSHVLFDGIIANVKPKFCKFTLDSLGCSGLVFTLHFSNKLYKFPVNHWPANSARLPFPVKFESFVMPANNCLWFDDNQCGFPMVPDFEQPGPKDTVYIFDLRPFDAALLDSQLLTEGKVFKNDVLFTPEYKPE